MVKHSFKTLIAAFMALALFSCAEDKSDSNREIQERILNAYVNTADFKRNSRQNIPMPSSARAAL